MGGELIDKDTENKSAMYSGGIISDFQGKEESLSIISCNKRNTI
jgi:hypothetical protein